MIVQPVYRLFCDRDGCNAKYTTSTVSDTYARLAAQEDGWQIRPFAGKGSRRGPDLCPAHRVAVDA